MAKAGFKEVTRKETIVEQPIYREVDTFERSAKLASPMDLPEIPDFLRRNK